ncbi:RluA family pseudouridine synthase [Chitinophagales bacterium]|nr:RluA family pseudouridine synthase [Chitinophagales bacterium]
MDFKLKKAGVKVLHIDENYIVVSKPSGLLTIQDRYKAEVPNLKQMLTDVYGEVLTVHRLDKDTSGVICFARNTDAHKHLNTQFANGLVKKIYWAFVQGRPALDEGQVDMPILNDMKNSGRMLIHKEGKEALTYFRTLATFGNIALLECFPKTGRTHQIRVHCYYLGCPLLVDALYHQKDAFYLSAIKRNYRYAKFEEERPLITRLTLHAKSIQFKTIDGKKLEVESELPKDLRALHHQLEKS